MKTTYTCAGPRVLAVKMRAAVERKIADLKARIDQTAEEVSGPLVTKLAEFEAEQARLADLPGDANLGRQGCGTDLTPQIEAIPEDGEVYEYQCPQCGNTGTVRRTPPAAVETPATGAA